MRCSPVYKNHLQDNSSLDDIHAFHWLCCFTFDPKLQDVRAVVPEHRAILHRSDLCVVLRDWPNHSQPADGNHASAGLHLEASSNRFVESLNYECLCELRHEAKLN